MRTHKVKLGQHEIVAGLNFKAMQAITDRVMDPMMIARDQLLAEEARAAGRPYEPKFQMTVRNIVALLHAAHEAVGGALSFDEIGDMVMDAGPANCIEPVGEFLLKLVAGESRELPQGKGKKGGRAGNE